MAHKKVPPALRNGRDSNAQRLGVKRFGVSPSAPVRSSFGSAGTHFHPGVNVGRGGDDTLFALTAGTVDFGTSKGRRSSTSSPRPALRSRRRRRPGASRTSHDHLCRFRRAACPRRRWRERLRFGAPGEIQAARGPDGGDGGSGGDVVLVADPDTASLLDVAFHPHRRASDGGAGQGSNRHGAMASDVVVPVPVGTVVTTESGEMLCDLAARGERFVVAHGGRGGLGKCGAGQPAAQGPWFRAARRAW